MPKKFLCSALAVSAALIIIPTRNASAVPLKSKVATLSDGIISATSGCSNKIYFDALDSRARLVASRKIVNSSKNVEVTPLDVDNNTKRLLFERFDCKTSKRTLMEETLDRKPKLKILRSPNSSFTLIDAGYDVMSNKALVLYEDSDLNYFVYKYQGAWKLIWTASLSDLDTTLNGIETSTGGEFYLFGNSRSERKWNYIRVAHGYTHVQATGPGTLSNVTQSILETITVFMGDQSWACGGVVSGSVAERGKNCLNLRVNNSEDGVLVFSNVASSYWFINGYRGFNRKLVKCPGYLFSDCTPSVTAVKSGSTTSGQNYIHANTYEVDYWNLGSLTPHL